MKAMKEFVHRMLFDCTHFFLKQPYGIDPAEAGRNDQLMRSVRMGYERGDPFYRWFGWVCP